MFFTFPFPSYLDYIKTIDWKFRIKTKRNVLLSLLLRMVVRPLHVLVLSTILISFGWDASSETQGRSVGPGEKAQQKFSSTGGKTPGYQLSPDHFQTVKRMLVPDWTQKMLCIILPNWRTASPEFFSWVRTRRLLSCHSCPVRSAGGAI